MRHGIAGTAAIVALAGLGGCGGSGSGPGSSSERPSTWTYRGARLTAEIPRGWHVTTQPLTSVSSPVQQLVVSSYPIRRAAPDGGCRPARALRQMPAAGALLFMFEYRGPTHHDVRREPARPAHFRLDPRTLGPYECMGRSYMVRFGDHGRVFQAHVYLGRRAGARTRRLVTGILDSLRIARADPRAAAVWVQPRVLFTRAPYLGVACGIPN
jgi:hypothetical protein